jgi:hypothetical protein
MLDDRWGKAVAAIGDFDHPPAYPRPRLPSYPVTLTTPALAVQVASGSDIRWPRGRPGGRTLAAPGNSKNLAR